MPHIPFKKILVPVDFSGNNTNALSYATDLCESAGAELILFHVLEDYIGFDMFYDEKTKEEFMDTMEVKTREKLKEVCPRVKQRGVEVSEVVVRGEASVEICAYTKANGIDLIVLEPHGKSTGFLQKALFGSNHEKIIQDAGCPVMTVAESD